MNFWSSTVPGFRASASSMCLHDALENGHVAAEPHRQPEIGNAGARPRTASARALIGFLKSCGFLKRKLPDFRQRIDRDDLAAVPFRDLQRRQHPRMIRARILADDENRLGQLEILQRDRPLADPDRFLQREAARFVAHVRAIGQVVGAELADKKLVQKGGFVARAARGVERRLVRRSQRVQLLRQRG